MPCYKIHITGSVFKTGFRYFLKAKAHMLGITGKVYYKNETSVGIIAAGSKERLIKFLNYCQEGYPVVHIDQIEVVDSEPVEFNSFEVEDIPADTNISTNENYTEP